LPMPTTKPYDQQRGTAHERGYTNRWNIARTAYLRKHPLCVRCRQAGRISAASVVNHIKPHKGDMKLFWDSSNWESVCKTCHDSAIQKQERTGIVVGSSLDGRPIDPNHHWNR
jgi:5-methylcytosine-specific restriction protein A